MNYGATLKKHIKNTIISMVIVAVLLFVGTIVPQDFIKTINIITILFSGVLLINILRWIARAFMTFAFKSSKIVYSKAINKDIYFKCEDEASQFFVKIGSLFTITEATENKDGIVKKGFINCLETVDYGDKEEKEMCLASLGASWDISNKKELITAIDGLIAELNEGEETPDYSITWNTKRFGWFLKKVEKYQIKFKDINNKKSTKFPQAYDVQRAVFLLRDGLTCGLINLEELEEFKTKICDIINKEFNSLEDFIVDYLIGVCLFYEEKTIMGPGMERERFEGIKILMENDYFNKDLNKL